MNLLITLILNLNKTKFIIFRTQGKAVDPDQCRIVFNSNEMGQVVNNELIKPIDRIYNDCSVPVGLIFYRERAL
jgi:hypothetical protein